MDDQDERPPAPSGAGWRLLVYVFVVPLLLILLAEWLLRT
jgi:hypothetical protein